MNPSPKYRWWFFGVIISLTLLSIAGSTPALWPFFEVYWVARDLKDSNEYTRQCAAAQLGDMGPRASFAARSLSEMLQNEFEKPAVRAAAAYALAQIGVDSAEARVELIKALELGSPNHNRFPGWGCYLVDRNLDAEVANYIERLGVRAVPLLIDALSNPSANVRCWAAELLGRIGAEASPAIEPLRAIANDSDVHVRAVAEYSLWRITRDDTPVAAAILDLLKSSDADAWEATVAHLEAMGPNSHSVLAMALHEDDSRIRAAAVEAVRLQFIGDRQRFDESLSVLTPALEDPDSQIRLLAALKISQSSAPKLAIPVLIAGLSCDDADLRQQAAAALGDISARTTEAVDGLVRALEDSDSSVRCTTARSIGEIGLASDAVVQSLTRALSDRTSTIRAEAARALGKLGPQAADALPALRELSLQDKFPTVRQSAAQAIGMITTTVATIGTSTNSL